MLNAGVSDEICMRCPSHHPAASERKTLEGGPVQGDGVGLRTSGLQVAATRCHPDPVFAVWNARNGAHGINPPGSRGK